MKIFRNILISLVLLALCCGAAFGLEYRLWNGEKQPVTVFHGTDLYEGDLENLECHSAYYDQGYYVVTDGDPFMLLRPDPTLVISHVRVRLWQPAEAETPLQLFYAGESVPLSEANSVRVTVPAGAKSVDIYVPENTYQLFRFDFDGNMPLQGFDGGVDALEEPAFAPNWLRMGCIALGFVLLCALGWLAARKKTFLKALLCLALGAVIAFAVQAGVWYSDPNSLVFSQDTVTFRLYPDMIGALYNCEFDGTGAVVPTDADPQIHFPTYDAELQGILITLAAPAEETIPVQVFYGGAGMAYAPRHSVIASIAKGTSQLAVTIPKNSYHLIRTDFDRPVRLAAITAGPDPVNVSRVPLVMDWRVWTLVSLLAAVLLYLLFVSEKIRRGLSRVNRSLLSPETRHIAVDWVYAVFAGLIMLHHLYVLAYFPTVMSGVPMLNIPFVIFGVLSVVLGRMWKDRGFWFFAAYWLYNLLRVFIPHPEQMSAAEVPVMVGLYCVFGCYAAGRALRPDMRRGFLMALCGIITAAMAFVSVLGIWVAWTDGNLTTPGGSGIYLMNSRLFLIHHSSTSGNLVSCCAVLAIFGAFLSRHKWTKILYVLAALTMVLANALTATRTGYITVAAALALVCGIGLYQKIGRAGSRSVMLALRNGLILFLVFAVVLAGLTVTQSYIVNGFNMMKLRGGLVVSRAMAESASSAGTTQLVHRDFAGFTSLDRLLSGRWNIWITAMQNLLDNPRALLLGWSVVAPMEQGTNQQLAAETHRTFEHVHNLYIQTLLESGIAGFLLFAAGVACFLLCALWLVRRKDVPLWQKMLPLPALAVLIEECDECIAIFSRGYLPIMILYLFMGMTAAAWAAVRVKEKKAAQALPEAEQ